MNVLSDVELASLDLLIEMKRSGQLPLDFINVANIVNDANNLANNVGNAAEAVAAVTAAAAAVAAVAAGAITPANVAARPLGANLSGTAPNGIGLDTLIEIRRRALDVKNSSKP